MKNTRTMRFMKYNNYIKKFDSPKEEWTTTSHEIIEQAYKYYYEMKITVKHSNKMVAFEDLPEGMIFQDPAWFDPSMTRN